jgi:hypothetical protein
MMRRRTLRITAWILIFLIGTIALEGYDVLSGANITEALAELDHGDQLFKSLLQACVKR